MSTRLSNSWPPTPTLTSITFHSPLFTTQHFFRFLFSRHSLKEPVLNRTYDISQLLDLASFTPDSCRKSPPPSTSCPVTRPRSALACRPHNGTTRAHCRHRQAWHQSAPRSGHFAARRSCSDSREEFHWLSRSTTRQLCSQAPGGTTKRGVSQGSAVTVAHVMTSG